MAKSIGRRTALTLLLASVTGCGGKYINPEIPRALSPAKNVHFGPARSAEPWPDSFDNPPADAIVARVQGSQLRATMINHSTILLQVHGLNILTDPIWSNRASPVSFAGPKRYRAAGISLDDLPKIDAVLVSHNHYDHLDVASLRKLWNRDRPMIIAPRGNARTIANADGAKISELLWNETIKINPTVTVTLLPALHWSARGMFDRRRALWGAFAISTPSGSVYFAGDTAYNHGTNFRNAAKSHGPYRLALLPIGAYLPRDWTSHQHLDPDQAVRAHIGLNSQHSIGMHFGTFRLTDETHDLPEKDLNQALRRHNIPQSAFRTLQNGKAWDIPESRHGI